MSECPRCHSHKALAQYADSALGKLVYIVYKCKGCGYRFRRREKPRYERAQLETDLNKAKTEKDREQARKESKIYRLNLIFTDEEADIVRTALGKQPAQTILFWATLDQKDKVKKNA